MREKIREKGKAEAPKTLKMPVFSRVLDLKLDKFQFVDLIWEQKTAKDFVSLAAFFSKLEPGENLHQHIYALLHILHRDILEPSVVVLAAGAQVGTGQPFVA